MEDTVRYRVAPRDKRRLDAIKARYPDLDTQVETIAFVLGCFERFEEDREDGATTQR